MLLDRDERDLRNRRDEPGGDDDPPEEKAEKPREENIEIATDHASNGRRDAGQPAADRGKDPKGEGRQGGREAAQGDFVEQGSQGGSENPEEEIEAEADDQQEVVLHEGESCPTHTQHFQMQ